MVVQSTVHLKDGKSVEKPGQAGRPTVVHVLILSPSGLQLSGLVHLAPFQRLIRNMGTLPTLADIRNGTSSPTSPLAIALDLLFEHSPILINTLEPKLNTILKSNPPVTTYTSLIDIALQEIEKWNVKAQSEFISGHPRIGENKNLSKLSANEQGAQGGNFTPPEVLARLKVLNALYEQKYPGLRYITFVNGRSRAEIVEEMESKLGLPHSLSDVVTQGEKSSPIEFDSEGWRSELGRAIYDIGRIAKNRLRTLGSS